ARCAGLGYTAGQSRRYRSRTSVWTRWREGSTRREPPIFLEQWHDRGGRARRMARANRVDAGDPSAGGRLTPSYGRQKYRKYRRTTKRVSLLDFPVFLVFATTIVKWRHQSMGGALPPAMSIRPTTSTPARSLGSLTGTRGPTFMERVTLPL